MPMPRFINNISFGNILISLTMIGGMVVAIWQVGRGVQQVEDSVRAISQQVSHDTTARRRLARSLDQSIVALGDQEHRDVSAINGRLDVLTSAVLHHGNP